MTSKNPHFFNAVDADLEWPAHTVAEHFAPTQSVNIQHFDFSNNFIPSNATQTLNAEAPIALVCNDIAWAVMMATPTQVLDFALGFAISEGIIDHPSDCYDLHARALPSHSSGLPDGQPAIEVALHIATRCMQRLQSRRRALSGRTGCGVCGVESIQGLDIACKIPQPITWPDTLDDAATARAITRAMAALPAHQPLRRTAGAIHAAAWVDLDGHIQLSREDIGRHNALDKLIGALAKAHVVPRNPLKNQENITTPALADLRGIALLSSRASHELIRKCARAGLGVLATAAAPTHLAVALARAHGVQLWAQCRADSATRYA